MRENQKLQFEKYPIQWQLMSDGFTCDARKEHFNEYGHFDGRFLKVDAQQQRKGHHYLAGQWHQNTGFPAIVSIAPRSKKQNDQTRYRTIYRHLPSGHLGDQFLNLYLFAVIEKRK